MECSVCFGTFRDPVQVVGCGHVYCEACIRMANEEEEVKLCPTDRNPYEQSFKDESMKRIVLSMKVKCRMGCQWIGELFDLEGHMKNDCTAEEGIFKVTCIYDDCSKLVEKRLLLRHLKYDCNQRLQRCEFCQQCFPQENIQEHSSNECQQAPVQCKFDCKLENLTRGKIEDHHANCDLRTFKCTYSHLGCEFEGQQVKLDMHLSESVQVHLDKAVVKINEQQARFIEHEQKFTALEEKLKEYKNNERKPIVSIWPIPDFPERLRSAKNDNTTVIYSPHYYTWWNGYKYKIMLYPNGNRGAENNNISVYFKLVKGDYDGILEWPFTHKVTLSILSQDNENQDQTNSYEPAGQDAFQRPTGDNEGWGFEKLLEHSKVETYAENDVLYVKCVVSEVESE